MTMITTVGTLAAAKTTIVAVVETAKCIVRKATKMTKIPAVGMILGVVRKASDVAITTRTTLVVAATVNVKIDVEMTKDVVGATVRVSILTTIVIISATMVVAAAGQTKRMTRSIETTMTTTVIGAISPNHINTVTMMTVVTEMTTAALEMTTV